MSINIKIQEQLMTGANKIMLQSFVDDVLKDIEKAAKEVRTKAAKHIVKKMKEKVSDEYFKGYHSTPGEPPGKVRGDLRKGIKFSDKTDETLVGVGPPAYHAHLMEFGTDFRYTRGKTKKGGSRRKQTKVAFRGKVEPRPFMLKTFEEENEKVKEIMSEQWV